MPVIRYTLNENGESFQETDTFEPTDDATSLVNEKILGPLNKRREELEEPTLTLEKVEVVNPFLHLHSWKKTFVDRNNLRVNYTCERCGITGHKPFNIFKGEGGAIVTRDYDYQNEKKFGLCKDPLKALPKKIVF